jgi:hypothetical protein
VLLLLLGTGEWWIFSVVPRAALFYSGRARGSVFNLLIY